MWHWEITGYKSHLELSALFAVPCREISLYLIPCHQIINLFHMVKNTRVTNVLPGERRAKRSSSVNSVEKETNESTREVHED